MGLLGHPPPGLLQWWLQFLQHPACWLSRRAVHTPALISSFFFPCLLFPVAFPFFPASQGNEKKVRKPRTQGNFLLLLLLFQDREVTPPTPSPYVSCRFSSFLPPLSSWASLVAVLNAPPSVQRPSGYRAGGCSWPLAASQVLLLSPLPCPSMCSELPRASGSPLLKLV